MKPNSPLPCSQKHSLLPVLSLKSFHRIPSHPKPRVTRRTVEWDLTAHRRNWKTTPYWLSATAYSVSLHPHSISGGRLLHPQHENAPRRVKTVPTQHHSNVQVYRSTHAHTHTNIYIYMYLYIIYMCMCDVWIICKIRSSEKICNILWVPCKTQCHT